jgi:hypothetical protein
LLNDLALELVADQTVNRYFPIGWPSELILRP